MKLLINKFHLFNSITTKTMTLDPTDKLESHKMLKINIML